MASLADECRKDTVLCALDTRYSCLCQWNCGFLGRFLFALIPPVPDAVIYKVAACFSLFAWRQSIGGRSDTS